MTDTLKELWDALEELEQIEDQWKKQLVKDAHDFWHGLDEEQQQLAFYNVVSRIVKGELEDQGSFRYILYEVFGFGPESYLLACEAGFMALHNSIDRDVTTFC